MTAVATQPVNLSRRRRKSSWDRSTPAFLGPAFGLAAAFLLLPMVLAFVYSTAKIAALSGDTSWVGVANYATMFTDPTFYRSLVNTAVFTLLTVPLGLAIGLGLAVLFNSVLPARKLFRTIVYLPLVISGVAVGLIGTFLYNETVGVLDKILVLLGLPSVSCSPTARRPSPRWC